MTSQEFEKILQKYLNNTATEQEELLVEHWFAAMGETHAPSDTVIDAGLKKKIWRKLDSEGRSVRYPQFTKVAAAISVVVLGCLGLMKFIPSEPERQHALQASGKILTVANHDGLPKRINLSDGSIIVLQPDGEVEFPETFGDQREVMLKGEAFFEVKRNPAKPFLVYANEVTTKVLGTSFTVKAKKEEKEIIVAVKTGRVSVVADTRDEKQEIILLPNQEAVFNRQESKVSRKIVDEPIVVTESSALKANYVNTPVVEILKALETSYGVDIQFDEKLLTKCTLTSDMSEVGLYDRIEIICNAIGAHYVVSDVTVIIEGKPCE